MKLFITYVDFCKAYNKISRYALIKMLAKLGCGYTMACAIAALYADTKLALGAAVILISLGVRQGSPSSCFLFTLFTDKLVRDFKEQCPDDGFLGWSHALLLMDDTVILSTTREGCEQKIKVLKDFCDQYGMEINEKKTKFMVINGDESDRKEINLSGLVVTNCIKQAGAKLCQAQSLV